VLFGQSANPYQLRFSTDGKYIASVAETFNGHACVWDYQSGKLLLSLKKPDPRAAAFTFLPNTDLVAFGHDDGIQIWNIQSSNLVKTITGMATNISALAGSPDGRKLAAGRLDGSVMFYNLEGLWDLRIRTTSESGSYIITFNAMPSSRYTLLSSTDLRTWSSRTNIPPASISSQVQLPITSSDPTQFFQLIQE
jgi:WD40 repeat protein